MRDAQKRYSREQGSIAAMELEKQFDEAIQPYMDYAKSMEAASHDPAPDYC